MSSRPEIPEAVKREVRQRCGFGCVKCGAPLYEYDHMVEYSVVQEHTADNITLLCSSHHDIHSRGQLPIQVLRSWDSAPVNRQAATTAEHPLFYFGAAAEVIAGGNRIAMSSSASAIVIDDHSLVGFELIDGVMHLNVDLVDSTGSALLRVVRNELVHSTEAWDVTYVGTRLTLRKGPGEMLISIDFDAPNGRVVVDRGLVSHNGVEVLFDSRGMCVLNNRMLMSSNMMAGMSAAIVLGDSPSVQGPSGMRIEVPREPFDRSAAVRWARGELRRLTESNDSGVAPPIPSGAVEGVSKAGWILCKGGLSSRRGR